MKHSPLDPATLRQIVFDTLDDSDDLVLILERTDESASGIVVAAANDAFCRASGYSHAEVVGQPLHALAAPNSDPASYADVVHAAHNLKSFRSEVLCNRRNGTPFWLGLHIMPVRDSIPQRFVILGRDITDSLQARQQQAAVQGLLAKVFLCVQVPVAIVTDDGMMQMTNPALEHLLGYPPGGLVGKRAIDCTAPSARAITMAALKNQIENRQDYTLRTALLRSDGTEIALTITSVTAQRTDLRHFRIITVLNTVDEKPLVAVHVAGKIRLVSLQEVKTELGVRWADAAARAMASAEHVIGRHCGPRDTYSRTPNGEFLVCFGDATEDEAAFRAAAMEREIRNRLIGGSKIESTAQVSAIPQGTDVPNELGRTADMLTAMINGPLSGRLAETKARVRETLSAAALSAPCELEPINSRRTNGPVAQYAQLPYELEKRIHAACNALPPAEREAFDFDRLVLSVAAEQATADIATGRAVLTLLSVQFDVFLDRRCTERYLSACQALNPPVRERLILVLAGMPGGCPQSQVVDFVTRVRPFCCGLGIQWATLNTPTVDLSIFGSPIVVLQNDGVDVRNAEDMAKLTKLVANLHSHKAHVLVRRVQSWEDAEIMYHDCDVDLVSVLPVGHHRESVILQGASGLH